MVMPPKKPLLKITPTGGAAGQRAIGIGSLVEYEQHGNPILGWVLAERKGRWSVQNEAKAELELPSERLFLYPEAPSGSKMTRDERASYLDTLKNDLQGLSLPLHELWEVTAGEKSSYTLAELTDIQFPTPTLTERIAIRRTLLQDTIYFKRTKFGFEPRTAESVEGLLKQAENLERKRRSREQLVQTLLQRIQGESECALPPEISQLIQYALYGKEAPDNARWAEVTEEIIARGKLPSPPSRAEERAPFVLFAAGVFSANEDLNLRRSQRPTSFSEAALAAIPEIAASAAASLATTSPSPLRRDLRHLSAITIDSASTRDVDDALTWESLENGRGIIGIHISDVASFLKKGTVLYDEAFRLATSIYTPDYRLPMLPPALSEQCLSLHAGEDKAAMSFLLTVNEELEIEQTEILPSLIQVTHRLSYDEADEILENDTHPVAPLLQALWRVSAHREGVRIGRGALQLSRKEMLVTVGKDGTLSLEENFADTPSHKLVSELMILANETAALYAKQRELPLIFRSQEAPEVDPEEQGQHLPDGGARDFFKRSFLKRSVTSLSPLLHSGLGLEAYAQVTSPIRRMGDLLNQFQLLSPSPLTKEEFQQLMDPLQLHLDEAAQIQRNRERFWLLTYIQRSPRSTWEGVVVRADGPRPLVEIEEVFAIFPFVPAIGMDVVRRDPSSIKHLVGTTIRLKVTSISPREDAVTFVQVE